MKQEPDIEKIYSLSPMQKGMLFHYLKDENTTAYTEQRFFTLEGDIDPDCLEKSICFLVERYDIFRTVFRYEKAKEPLQIVFKNRNFYLHFEDISQMPGGKQEKYLENIKKDQRQKGFDFRKDLLIRVFLFKTAASTWKLLWTYHHIIMDGWCTGIIINQLIRVYKSLKHDQPLRLKPAVPYREYIRWLKKQDPEQGLLYWREYLDGCDRQASLLGPGKPPAPRQYQLKEHRFIIPTNLEEWMNQLAVKNQATLFDLLKTTWGILLQKFNDTDDVVFGTVVSGRPPEIKGVGDMVGLFINTIPLRIQTKEKQEFRQLLEQVSQETLSSRSYEYLPLAEVQSQSALKEHLIDHIMVYENYPPPRRQGGSRAGIVTGFWVTRLESHEQTSYDLNVLVIPGKNLTVVFNYNAAVYETGFLEKTANRFLNLLNEVTDNPDREISKIGITTLEEKEQILLKFNETRREYPRDKTIHALFAEQAQRTPDHIAVVGVAHELHELNEISSSEGARGLTPLSVLMSITYKKLYEKSHQLAHVLGEQGIKPDTIVGIMGERSHEMIIGILGILKAGGAYSPIDPEYPQARIDYMLKDSDVKILVTVPGLAEKFKKLLIVNCQLLIVNEIPSNRRRLNNPPKETNSINNYQLTINNLQLKGSNLAYILYTSGTSGRPKGVMVEHRSVVRLVKNTDYIEFQPGQKVLQTSPLEFDVSTFEIWGPLLNGGILYEIPRQELLMPQTLGNRIKHLGIETLWMTAPLFNRMVEADINIFAGIKDLLVGGEALSPPHINRVKQHYPCLNVINGYGPTENTTFSTAFRVDREYESNIPIGKPIANSTVYILDRDFNLQPIGIVGELVVGGDGLSRGYLNAPQLTSGKFLPISNMYYRSYMSYRSYISKKLYRTGDLACWLSDGNIEFLGRMDHQMKIRGYRIEPGEIENRLSAHPHIKNAVVVTREDKTGDKYLCAYILTVSQQTPGKGPAMTEEFKQYLARLIPDYMVPTYFVTLEELPLTPSGKIDRKRLPAPELKDIEEYTAPRTSEEKKLAEIWAEVLGIEKNLIGIDHNFFDLGGHSLKASILISRIHKKLDTKLSLDRVFKFPTIRGLSACLATAARERFSPIKAVEKKEFYELTFNQKRLWYIQQKTPGTTSYHMGEVIFLNHRVDIEALQSALKKLSVRHESLRTGFEEVKGKPVQFVLEMEDSDLPFQVRDVSALEEEERKRRTAQIITEVTDPPFDLRKPSLFRAALIKQHTENYLLVYNMHHIISDGWSMEILKKDFNRYYRDYANGKEPLWEPLLLQYKDFTHWHNEQIQDPGHKDRVYKYWKKKVETGFPLLELTHHYHSHYTRDNRHNADPGGGWYRCAADQILKERLHRLAQKNQTSLFMVLFSIYNLLMAFLSGQDEVVSVVISAGRQHDSLHPIVGYFINPIIIKTHIILQEDFENLLSRINREVLEVLQYQEYPLELMLDDMKEEFPQVGISFNMLNMQDISTEMELDPLTSHHNKIHQDLKFDIALSVLEYKNGIDFNWSYRSTILNPKTMENFAQKYLELMEDLTLDDESKS